MCFQHIVIGIYYFVMYVTHNIFNSITPFLKYSNLTDLQDGIKNIYIVINT